MYLGCQCVILYLLVLILVFVIKFYSDKCNENDKNNWYSILKTKIEIFGIVFLFVFIAFLISNIVFTFLEKNQHIAESVLDYKDVVNLFPAYLTLAVTIIIAFIQFFIQDDLQKKAKEEQAIQQIHYEKIREIDIKAHMNEQLAESLKRYFYFDGSGKLNCFEDRIVEISIKMPNEAISSYFSVEISAVVIECDLAEERICIESSNVSFSIVRCNAFLRLENPDLYTKTTTIMEDAMLGNKKTGKLIINAKITDNSLSVMGNDENNGSMMSNNDIDIVIETCFQPNGQISPDDGLYIDVYDVKTKLSA